MQSIGGYYAQVQIMKMQMIMGSARVRDIGTTGGVGDVSMMAMMAMQPRDMLYSGFLGFVGVVGFEYCSCKPRITDDPYGIAQSGQGVKSNLANSVEDLLAMKDILSSGGKTNEAVVKELKEKYGIQAEVGDITTTDKDGTTHTKKGVKFADGDYFVDGNGNGSLDTGDYKFDDAISKLKEKYHLTDSDITSITENMKKEAESRSAISGAYDNPYQFTAMFGWMQQWFGTGMGVGTGMGMVNYWTPMMMMFEEAMAYAA